MNEYVLKVLRKSKKAISLEEIIGKVKNRYLKDNPDKKNLSEDDILEIMGIVEELEKNYEIIRIGDGFKLLRNTSFHKGKFFFDSKGAKVVEDNSYINGFGDLVINKTEFRVSRDGYNGAHSGDLEEKSLIILYILCLRIDLVIYMVKCLRMNMVFI